MKIIIFNIWLFSLFLPSLLADSIDHMRIVAGDSFILSVSNLLNEEEYNSGQIKIGKKKYLVIPRLGRVELAGKTVGELKNSLEFLAREKLYLKDPIIFLDYTKMIEVSVLERDLTLKKVVVELGTTLIEVFGGASGGTQQQTPDNDLRSIRLKRDGKEKTLNVLDDENAREYLLRDRDFVVVPTRSENPDNFYYLAGHFYKPGRYLMDGKMSLMDILATADATLEEPRFTRRFYILRKSDNSGEVISVDARKLLKMGDVSEDHMIRGGDIVLASLERKVHTINKLKAILNKYIDIDDLFQRAETLRFLK